MRITIATGPCLPAPPLRGGGMIRAWMALARAFAADGHVVTLLARAFPGQSLESIQDGYRIRRWGGYDQPRSTWVSLLKDISYAWGACNQLPEADILVTNDFWLPFFAPWRRANAGLVVVSVNRFPKHQLVLYHRAALLVVPTMALERAIEAQASRWVPRTTCIANPLDERAFHDNAEVERDSGAILYVGRLHPEKGVALLIEAFRELLARIPDIHLTIAGPHAVAEGGGGESFFHALQKKASNLPIRFTGPIHEESSLARLYQSHAVFCYPSLADHGEAMGIAPLEAMACGCVPIVSANPVFSDWLLDGTNGWSFNHHSPKRVQLLAQSLYECLDDTERLQNMSTAALNTARRFGATAISERFLKTFESLLDESR